MLLLGVPEGGSDLFLAIPETRLVVKNHSCVAVAGELARMVTQQRDDTFSWLLGFSAFDIFHSLDVPVQGQLNVMNSLSLVGFLLSLALQVSSPCAFHRSGTER